MDIVGGGCWQAWTVRILLLMAILLLSIPACEAQATDCRTPQIVEGQIWAKEPVKFNVDYVIGYTDANLSCFEIVEIMDGRGYKVNMTFDVKLNGMAQHAEGVFDMDADNIGTVTLHDEANTVLYTSPDITPNGIILLYVCAKDKQYILIQYVTELGLRIEAEEAARQLTDDAEKYRVNWNDCQAEVRNIKLEL